MISLLMVLRLIRNCMYLRTSPKPTANDFFFLNSPYAAIVHMDTNFLWGPGGPSEPWFDYGGEHVAPWWTDYDPNLNSIQFNSFGGAGVRMTFNC